MALDLDVGSFIRAGAALLYALMGLFLLAVARQRHAALGVFFVGSGLSFAVLNLSRTDTGGAWGLVAWALGLVGLAAGTVLVRNELARLDARGAVWAAAAVSALLVTVGAIVLYPARAQGGLVLNIDWPPTVYFLYVVYFLAFNALSAVAAIAILEGLRSAVRGPPAPAARALLAVALAATPAYTSSAFLIGYAGVPSAGNLGLALGLVFGFAVSVWGLRATAGPNGRVARNVILALVPVSLFGAALALIGSFQLQAAGTGMLRILALLPLAYAIFRLDLLGVPLQRLTIRAGTLASLGLVALFISAQVAQNFLSAEYGLFIGGAIAGLLVFAAFPLQRAAERAMEQRSSRGAAASAADNYRRQVVIAWTDGRLGANEKLLLAEARRQLGLDAETAARIDDDVAADLARRPPTPRRASARRPRREPF